MPAVIERGDQVYVAAGTGWERGVVLHLPGDCSGDPYDDCYLVRHGEPAGSHRFTQTEIRPLDAVTRLGNLEKP